MSVVSFVGQRRKSEINTKSKVMSCWLREQMANRRLTSISFRFRNGNKSILLSIFHLRGKRLHFLIIKMSGLCPADNSTESWVIIDEIPGRFLPQIRPPARLFENSQTRKKPFIFCNDSIVVNLISNKKKCLARRYWAERMWRVIEPSHKIFRRVHIVKVLEAWEGLSG